MDNITIPCEVTLSSNALGVIPDAMFTHVVKGGKLYLVKQPEDGRAFICTHPDFIGKVCTSVSTDDLTIKIQRWEGGPHGLGGGMAALIVLSILIGFAIEAWKVLH